MSILSDITNYTSAFVGTVDREIVDVRSKLSSVTSEFVGDFTAKFEAGMNVVKSDALSFKTDIDNDFASMKDQLVALKNRAETDIGKVFSATRNTFGKMTDDFNSLGKKIKTKASDATTFLRGMRNDAISAVMDAGRIFDKAETSFVSHLKTTADGFLLTMKTSADGIGTDIETQKANFTSDIVSMKDSLKNHIDSVIGDLEDAKLKLKVEFDDIIAYGKTEVLKLETRMEGIADKVNKVVIVVSVGVVVVCGAYMFFEIVRKEHAKRNPDPDEKPVTDENKR
jgi:hypothetical protein